MRSILTVLVVGLFVCGLAVAAGAQQPFLGFDRPDSALNAAAPAQIQAGYPPQYYKAYNASTPGWVRMGGGSEFKPTIDGFDRAESALNAAAPAQIQAGYPPQYYKAYNASTPGWVNMGGSK